MNQISRRALLKSAGTAATAPLLGKIVFAEAAKAAALAAKPTLQLSVMEFGAKADGTTKDTVAIQQAIDRCWVLGGGEAVVPAGKYLTAAIQLRPNVTLRLEKDAELIGSGEMKDYPVAQVRWEGKWIQGHHALIYAMNADNIGIVGPGKITGNNALGGRPTAEQPLRHPALIEPIGCTNVRFEDFSTSYFRMWSIHPTYCENVFIKGLTIRSTGGNGDGIDVDSCKHVRIDNCDINTGDDCISLKSGRGAEANTLMRTTEDVHISNCTFVDSIFACIGIGSETSGGIRNVLVENCKFKGAKTHAIYIKSRPGRGAFIEDITFRNCEAWEMTQGFIRLNQLHSGIQDQNPVPGFEGIPTFRNFKFQNFVVHDAPMLLQGDEFHPDKPMDGLLLENISGTAKKGMTLVYAKNVTLKNVTVTVSDGPKLSTYSVTGKGLEGAVALPAPPKPDEVKVEKPYVLR